MSVVCKTVYTPESGACIYSSNFPRKKVNDKIYYGIPELDIYIDEISYHAFKNPDYKVFYAIEKENGLYYLQPLTKEQHKKYQKDKQGYLYKGSNILGQGTYGKVKGYETQKSVVKISLEDEDDDIPQDIVKEIAIYRLLKDINFLCIPRLQNFQFSPQITMQMSKGLNTLSNFIENINFKVAKDFMFRLAKCLKIIASQGIMNLDLKPDNLIIIQDESKNYKIQIIDWGIAEIDYSMQGKSGKSTHKQTLWWRSPEILADNIKSRELERQNRNTKINRTLYNTDYSYKVDIFSLGIIFMQLARKERYPPFRADENDPKEQAGNFIDYYLKPVDYTSVINEIEKLTTGESVYDRLLPNIKFLLRNMGATDDQKNLLADLVCKMMEFNPKYRINYDEIILHPFFQDIKRESIPFPRGLINNMPSINIVNDELRRKALEKINYACIYNKSKLYTTCLAIQLFDLYRSKMNIPSDTFAVACAVIASKLFDDNHLQATSFDSPDAIIEYQKDILEILDGNVLIPSLMSYYMYRNEEVKDLNVIPYFYARSDVYKTDFKKINFQDLIPFKFKKFGISIFKDEFKLNSNGYYETRDILIPEEYKNVLYSTEVWDIKEYKDNKPVLMPDLSPGQIEIKARRERLDLIIPVLQKKFPEFKLKKDDNWQNIFSQLLDLAKYGKKKEKIYAMWGIYYYLNSFDSWKRELALAENVKEKAKELARVYNIYLGYLIGVEQDQRSTLEDVEKVVG